ncbi:MAG: metalloregulator ArsR/SmtB family transcription factor, partial [Gammaproteobacteria bacterium]
MRRMTAQLKPIPDLRASELLGFCKAMADQVRLNILSILDKESFGVLELCEILQLKQPALTHHLKLLTDAGLLTKRREGTS